MFRSVFDPLNGFWRGFARVCDIVGLSVCWVVCSLPVFTVGAATTALYDAVFHGIRKGELGDYARFFRTFRDSFKTATLVTVPALVLAAVLLYMWYVAYVMAAGGSQAAMLWLYACRILLLAPLAVWLFALFTLSRFTFGARGACWSRRPSWRWPICPRRQWWRCWWRSWRCSRSTSGFCRPFLPPGWGRCCVRFSWNASS